MVSTSKILTVSYGTFSCTLEGFDDPFSTMRSIAEYFRDLAADDRYFGAEPPTPDAEMLHRIAEREARRKVETHVEDNTIVLRQTESALSDSNAAIIPDVVDDQVLVQQAEPEKTVMAPISTGEKATKTSEPASISDRPDVADHAYIADMSDTSIAAKLQRLRAVAGASATEPKDDAASNLDNGLEDDFFSATSKANNTEELAEDETPDIGEGIPIAGIKHEPAAAETDESVSETEVFARIAAATSDIDDEPEAKITDDVATKQTAGETDGDADILSGISAALDHEPTAETALSDDDFENELDDEFDHELAAEFGSDESFEDKNDIATDQAPEPVAIARVVKVRRAEPMPTSAEPDEITDETTLSDDDEASLLADLAQAEDEAEKESEIISAGQKDTGDAQTLTAFDDGEYQGADALDRIMAEANTKIDSDESSRKRSSIAHLRAAVQAKRADGESPDTGDGSDTSEEYRDDLARVVEPGRPKHSRKRLGRSLAPLVLVSEQRVDEITAPLQEKKTAHRNEQAPVRPRRIRKAQAAETGGDAASPDGNQTLGEIFAAFAAQNQVNGTAELFEAAAAFRIYVKGQETFSRPQVMRLVLHTPPDSTLSREDALQAFGQLIREGMIKKIQRGRYTISENTRFRPGQERASA